MSNWSGLDYFIFLIFLLNTVLGMARGATKEIISMICLCTALVFTIKFSYPLALFINSSPLITDVVASRIMQNFMMAIGMGPITEFMLFSVGYCLSILICFVGVFCSCEAVLSYANVVQVFSFPYAIWDRKVGGALGCVRGYVIAVILILIYFYLSTAYTRSYFIDLFQNSARKLNYLIVQQAPERYREVLQDKNLFTDKMVLDALENPK